MTLSETWFMDGYIDFELQKYRLLAYLKEVNRCFNETKLYPQLSDMVFHYKNLLAFKQNKQFLQNSFPRQLTKVDMEKLELTYEAMLQDDELMQELEQILEYAVPQMKHTIDTGAEIHDMVEKQVRIEPVGILPLYRDEGYMLLHYGEHSEIRAYGYTITLFEDKDARYRGIKVQYIDCYRKSLANTPEHIKLDIIRNIRTLPNPAVFSVVSEFSAPLQETLLPIAKRMLVRHLA
ncbi:MAG: hypothetical protein JNL72_11865 [Flavipsychrobacter sp.]|nr:hypothetical protein [Flavipsychrobacter sp.]